MKHTALFSTKTALFIFVGIVLTGCGIPSVHPLYEPADLQVDHSLQGIWQKTDSGPRYHIIRIADLRGHLIHVGDTTTTISVTTDDIISGQVEVEQGVVAFFDDYISRGLGNLYLVQNESVRDEFYLVGVVELGGSRYLDFKKLDFDLGPFSYPVHLFMKSTMTGDSLNVNMFSENWLKEQIRNRQIRIKYEVNDDENYLLTAPTLDLQKFVEKYGGIDEAYRTSNTYVKVSDEPEFKFEELEESIEEE